MCCQSRPSLPPSPIPSLSLIFSFVLPFRPCWMYRCTCSSVRSPMGRRDWPAARRRRHALRVPYSVNTPLPTRSSDRITYICALCSSLCWLMAPNRTKPLLSPYRCSSLKSKLRLQSKSSSCLPGRSLRGCCFVWVVRFAAELRGESARLLSHVWRRWMR